MESHDAEFRESGQCWARGPKPTPDLTMDADELALRLLTSLEHLDRAEAERLLVEVRAVGRPSRFRATPAQLDAFLREHFAEDTLLRYQWAIGDAAAHQAAEEIRADAQKRYDRDYSDNRVFRQQGADAAADLIDPAKDGGHYPSVLVDFTPKDSGLLREHADGLDGGAR
jgi:hypothetical protein